MAYGKSKELAKITQSDKVLRDKAFNSKILWISKRTFFDKKNLVEVMLLLPNQIINLQMNFINRLLFKRRKVYSSLRENIWGVDLADTTKHALSECNK